MLKTGLKGEASVEVMRGNTAIEVGSGSVPVFATPMLVALMENAAINALLGALPEGQTTVGTKVDVAHTAATPIGQTVTARAQLVETDGRRLVFQVAAEDDNGPVGSGTHERFVVDLEKFLAKVKEKSS
ncbi:MAG: thioesterase family protein [Bacillota bacterium]|nr:thioesterase family protein [Bacillota bacterium]MDW7684677.1 thioesterase family protein [Bacillota bacterium]